MYKCLLNVDSNNRRSYYEEEKYGLKISVGKYNFLSVVRGMITNGKIIICFELCGSSYNTYSVDYNDEMYALLRDYAYKTIHFDFDYTKIKSMKISSLLHKRTKSARNY